MKNLLIVLALLSCGARAEDQPMVVTSIKPLALIAREIAAGTTINIQYLLAPSVSEHGYALKISDIKKLRDAKLVVWLGPSLEPYLGSSEDTWLSPSKSDKKSLPLLANIVSESSGDPHVWLSPILAQQLAKQIADGLEEIYPAQRSQIEENLKIFDTNASDLDVSLAIKLKPYRKTPFIVYHDAYGYFVSRYTLNQISILHAQPEAALSMGQLRKLQNAVKGEADNKVCVFREPQFSTAPLPALGVGVKVGELDPLGINANSYKELINNLAGGLLSCFVKKD